MCVRVTDRPGGGLVIEARDWPLAPWCALLFALPGVPLTIWALIEGQIIELGGGLVLCGFAGLATYLSLRHRRRLELSPHPNAQLMIREGTGPFLRETERTVPEDAAAVVVPFDRPEGAPELPDRGADLVLTLASDRVLVARAVGPAWPHLELVRAQLDAALGASTPR